MMSTSNEIDSSSSFFSSSKVYDLSKFVGEELDKVEESFEVAKATMEKVFVEINEARAKLNNLLIMQDQHHQQQVQSERGGRGGIEDQMSQTENHLRRSLKELNEKVSHFKFLIPSSLLVVKKEEKPPSESSSKPSSPPPPREPPPPPSPPHRVPSLHDFHGDLALEFLVAFPENTYIKKSLLHRFMEIVLSNSTPEYYLSKCNYYNLTEAVLKKGTNSVAGYRVNPLARTIIEKKLDSYPRDVNITGNIDNGEIIYSGPIQFSDMPSVERIYRRQNWEIVSTYFAEIDDLHLSFTCVCIIEWLRYLSLSGNSTMKELPECITKLNMLNTLDLEDCQNLEVIPSKIANLQDRLTCLDMSRCYSLLHMPPALAQLHNLRVLKGFVISQANIIKKDGTPASCTLEDLALGLRKLEKLTIYTHLKGFPNESDLASLKKFTALRKLTISWEGYSTTTSVSSSSAKPLLTRADHSNVSEGDISNSNNNKGFDFKLEKLDLQCVPSGISNSWLKPYNFPTLSSLYIRGGQLEDLRQISQDDDVKISNGSHHFVEEGEWSVHVLRLKYLKRMKIDWYEARSIFPKLHSLQIVDCPNLTSFPRDDRELHEAMEQLRRDRG